MVKANVIDALVARPGIFDVVLFEGVEKCANVWTLVTLDRR